MPANHTPISPFGKSEAYAAYASFPSRPKSFPVWSKNNGGQYIVQNGELYCQYEVKGAICTNTTRFAGQGALSKHIRRCHDPGMIFKVGRPSGAMEHKFLADFYTKVVQSVQDARASTAPHATASAPMPRTILNTPQSTPATADETEDEAGYEDEDDTAPSAAAIPTIPAPVVDRKMYRIATDQPTNYSLGLRIQRAQEEASEKRKNMSGR